MNEERITETPSWKNPRGQVSHSAGVWCQHHSPAPRRRCPFFLPTRCDNFWGGTMQVVRKRDEASNNYSPAMHSTAETMTTVSAIYRPTSGWLPQG